MFGLAEEEESFNPSASSNLASLFGASMSLQNNHDASLSYIAPRQPKSQEKISKPQSTVLCSKFVNAFKLVENEHVNQGKCGIAIIGIETLNAHDIIMYKSKQDIITRSKLKSGFIFHKQTNNFASFCDDQLQRWSLHFESAKEIEDFAKEIESHGGQILQETEPKQSDKDNDSFSDTSTNKTKASILSRMAKMGQSIIPKTNLPVSESDNSESEEKTVTKKTKKTRQPKEKDQAVNLPASQSEFVLINGTPMPVTALQQTYNLPLWSHSQPISDPFNIFVAENRTHNCEMRMNISQLSLKLDKIFEEVNKSKSSTNVLEPNQETFRNGDVRKLEEECELLRNKLKTANDVISNATVENENYRSTILQLEKEIENLQREMKTCNIATSELEKQREIINGLQKTLANQNSNLETLTQFYEEHKHNNSSQKIQELSESNEKLKTKFDNDIEKRRLFAKKLKISMNVLYQTMMETFSDENMTFRALEIKEVLSKYLKATTLDVIEEFSKDFGDNETTSVPN